MNADSNLPLPFGPEFLVEPAGRRRKRKPRAEQPGSPRTAVGAPGYLSVRRAAEILGLRPRSVLYLLARGRLSSQRLGRVHFLPAAEVQRYRRFRRERAARASQRKASRGIKLVH